MRYKLTLSLLLFFIGAFTLIAYRSDDELFGAILKKMEAYNVSHEQEKVHLHLDKPYYAIGDDIWFKAYVINAQTSKPSTISNILYVELINEKDSIKAQLKIPLIQGITAGDFKLAESFSEGNYRIRAYTRWMQNAGTEFFFDKTIKVGNSWSNKVFTSTSYQYSKAEASDAVKATIKFADKDGNPYVNGEVSYEVQLSNRSILKGKEITNAQGEVAVNFNNTQPAIYKSGKILTTLTLPDKKKVTKEVIIKATSSAIDVQFFPEGGNLVENIPAKVGIKITNSDGLGENAEGIIVDNAGQEIVKFDVSHFGLGNLIVNPEPGKTYTAKIKFKDGSEGSYNLPKAITDGYGLSVKNNENDIQVRIMLSKNMVGKGELKLVAQHNGNVYLTTQSNSSKQVISTVIQKKDLPSGILQLTLFSAENQPVCERLVFVRSSIGQISTALSTDKSEYNRKEKVSVVLSGLVNSNPIQGSFSVSVTNASAVKPDELNESNILTSLLLTSDIAGYVEKPNYYFLQDDVTTRSNLDNLMLTQGWRRFLWKNIIAGSIPNSVFSAEKSLQIGGIVTDLGGKKPIPNTSVSLYSTVGTFFGVDTLTDANGRFTFDNITFPDSTKFVVQAKNLKGKKNTIIKMDVVSGQLVTRNKNTGDITVNTNEALNLYLKQSENYFNELVKSGRLEKSIALKEVTIEQKKQRVTVSANLNGAGNADAILTADQMKNCITFTQCLQGLGGMMMRNGVPGLARFGGAPMQIVFDGMYVEAEFLNNINPSDVESVEVLKTIGYTSLYGTRGGAGVLVVTTKRGSGFVSSSSMVVPGIVTYTPKGYSIGRAFYAPKYEPNEPVPGLDLRSTIYWNPFIATNDNGKASFSFYNSGEPGTYRIVAEGIDANGNLAHHVYTYTVK
ncbi:MAG: TonB-dependent receptor plug domain-containing protein [Bacteroidota bacterium]